MSPPQLDWTQFDRLRAVLAEQGFNAIPLPPCAKGAGGSGVGFKRFNKPGSKRIGPGDRRYWERAYKKRNYKGRVNGYVLTASGMDWCYAVVDVDNPEFDELAVEAFGDSPLFVSRSGRVRHRYYRTSFDKTRESHLMAAWGKRTVDVICATGVVAPGSVHEDGNIYELSIPLEQWTPEWVEENVPFLDLDAVAELRAKKHGVSVGEAIRPIPVEGSAEGFIHIREPVMLSTGHQHSGYVFPSTVIQTVDGPRPLHEIEIGTRCYATYRKDTHPSSSISKQGKRVYFWDHSRSMYWEMIEPRDETTDPELDIPDGGNYYAHLEHALTHLGVEVELLEDRGYLADQLEPLGNNETLFLIAPHGAGKTVLARAEHDRACTSISVCNTQALTIANAAVLGLKAVYEGIDETEVKGSVCIPSLYRYEEPPEFFHVDEADAVHAFLHSGVVGEPLRAWHRLAEFVALSKRSLIASADLTFEDIALFVEAVRARNPLRRIRCAVRVPTRTRCHLAIRSLSYTKQALHEHLSEKQEQATFVGISTRKLAGQIAQGYRVANTLPTIDLDEVATLADVVDSPQPYPLVSVQDGMGDYKTQIEKPFFVSGENNRYETAVRWLENTDELVEAHDLIVTSPAVQSGVSLAKPVSAVFVLHQNRELPAESVLQLARRARDPQEKTILIGVNRWQPQNHRMDRIYLDDLIEKRAKTTIQAIADSFPSLAEDHEVEIDQEFIWSWRIRTRKLLRSSADPLGELQRHALRHGWEVDMDLDAEGDPEPFNDIIGAAKLERDRLNAETIAAAPLIEAEEKARLEASARLKTGERQKLERCVIGDFYDHAVTPELVTLDNNGKYRSRVRAYTHVKLMELGRQDIVAYLDHTRNKGKQPTELRHVFAKSMLLWDIVKIMGRLDSFEFRVGDARFLIKEWWRENREKMRTFFPKIGAPKTNYEVKWYGARLRSLGAKVSTKGKNDDRKKVVDFLVVDQYAEAYGKRLLDLFEQRDSEEWRKKWTKELRA